MALTTASLFLSLNYLVCGILLFKILTPPNAASEPSRGRTISDTSRKHDHGPIKDSLFPPGLQGRIHRSMAMSFAPLLALSLSSYHALLVFLQLSSNSPPLICPHPSNISHDVLTLTPYNVSWMFIFYLGALGRLAAYAQLGPNFTFQLAEPNTLRTTGLYCYIRHPSYTAGIAAGFAALFLLCRVDGGLGCWFDEGSLVLRRARTVNWTVRALWAALNTWAFGRRVEEEEIMLEETFGDEWRGYVSRTKKFIPWII